jgi:hypothetical protein
MKFSASMIHTRLKANVEKSSARRVTRWANTAGGLEGGLAWQKKKNPKPINDLGRIYGGAEATSSKTAQTHQKLT